MKDKIKELLGMNIPANVVATAVGVSESYISQLLSEETFAKEVAELRIAYTTANAARDRNYDSIEDSLIERLTEQLESPLKFTKTSELLAAIRVINSAKRRAAPQELSSQLAQTNIVQLQLPEGSEFAAKFIVNKENQVLEIAGRSIATMGAKAVVKKLEELNSNRDATPNKKLHDADMEEANSRIEGLVKMERLPVADLL